MPRQRRSAIRTDGLMSVVVATDFSRAANAAVRRVSALPLRPGARIRLVHVLPPGLVAKHPGASAAARHNLTQIAERLRQLLASRANDVTVRVLVMRGRTHEWIATAAHAAHADLVVVGRHGQRPLADLFGLGTTADRVLRTCGVPVLVVAGASTGPYRRPVLSMDLPPGDPVRAAARFARRIVAPNAQWTVLHVPEYPYISALRLGLASPRELASARRMLTQRARAAATAAAERLLEGVNFTVRVRAGSPQFVIAKAAAARSCDLLVIGTHSRRGLDRRLLGSVTDASLRRAQSDVLVTPGPPARPAP